MIDVLRAGPRASAPTTGVPQEPLQLDFMAGPPERTVTVHYNPGSQTLLLYNVPSASWPDHAVGTYTLPPAFGAALHVALAQQPAPHRP